MLGNRNVLGMILAAALISPVLVHAEGSASQAAQECETLTPSEITNWQHAVEVCLRAALEDASSARPLYKLGRALETGKQYEAAAKVYNRAADMGYAPAQDNLGALYANGDGVRKDIAQAMALFHKAAEQGLVNSELNLGRMYQNAKDFGQAAIWYHKAAQHGDIEAAEHLGVAYYYGRGVSKNDQEATFWFKKAAAAGSTLAQSNLDLMAEDQGASAPSSSEYERTKQEVEQGRRLRCGSYQMSGNRGAMSMIPGCY